MRIYFAITILIIFVGVSSKLSVLSP